MFYISNRKSGTNISKCILVIIFLAVLQIIFYNSISLQEVEDDDSPLENDNILLWWTPFVTTNGKAIDCDSVRCFVTSNRNFKTDSRLKAFLFYGSLFNASDLPTHRRKELWGLLHEESPRNTPLLSHEQVLTLFNYSSTFSRYSDLPLTLQYLPSINNITSQRYFLNFKTKSSLENSLSPVIYIQSDCVTPNNRDSYVHELMKYIRIDSYGECLHNKDLPLSLSNPLETMMSEELINFISRYKFAIAFENAVCEDYITEKLWRPIIAGTVPIYFGSPTIKDWLPNYRTAIFPSEFNSPKDLADYLIYLKNNATEYDSYRLHKTEKQIENNFLLKNFRTYEWSTDDDSKSVIDDFECMLCKNTVNTKINIIDRKHYDCPEPVSMIDNMYNISNWWHRDYRITKCEAIALRKFLFNVRESNFSHKVFTFNYIYDQNESCDLN